jgi:molecular chaperone DnaK (HSP70)
MIIELLKLIELISSFIKEINLLVEEEEKTRIIQEIEKIQSRIKNIEDNFLKKG